MTNALIIHQTQIFKTDRRFRVAMITVWSLFFVALLNGILFYQQNNKARTFAQEASYEQWLNQPKKNAHSAAHYGFYAYKPISIMTVVDKGLEDYLGSAVWLEAHNQNEVKVRTIQDAPFLARFGDLSIGFVWAILFPLLIILLSFNVISAEREQGTFRMLLVSGVSKYDIIKAKFWSVFQTVLWLFLPTFAVALFAMSVLNWDDFIAHLPHFSLQLSVFCLYFAFFSLVGVAISAIAKNSGYALFSLLNLWLLMCFVVPRLNVFVAQKTLTLPTAFDFTTEMKRTLTEGAKERTKALEVEYLTKYKVDSIHKIPVNFAGVSLDANDKFGDTVHDKFYDNLNAILHNQDRLIALGALFSPTLATRNISMALSGSDNDKQKNFENQAENHRRLIQSMMSKSIIDAPKDPKGAAPIADSTLWAKVPPFKYNENTITQIIENQLVNIFVLLFWIVGLWFILKRIGERIKA
jgi:ABC-2 type transport system permease protein